MMQSNNDPLDFGSLLSRNKIVKPAPVTQIVPREAFRRNDNPNRISINITKQSQVRRITRAESNEPVLPELISAEEIEAARKANELAYRLSLRTPFAKKDDDLYDNKSGSNNDVHLFKLVDTISLEDRIRLDKIRKMNEEQLPFEMHQVQMGDWETRINWEGVTGNTIAIESRSTPSINSESNPKSGSILPDPMDILSEAYNPSLEALDLDNMISWEGADAPPGFNERLAQRMGKLILQDGVAGSSVAAQSGAIPKMNPLPFNQSDVYKQRMELKLAGSKRATVGSLQKDHAALEKEIEERQQKRAQMAIDKTNRITGALGKLDFGGGTGRRVTSSLMGPGGTERSGRPNKQNIVSHDATYVEQLDMVMNHQMVKSDLSFSELRHYQRPLLFRKIFRPENIMPWQLQIRVVPDLNLLEKRRNGRGVSDRSMVNTYQNNMISNMPGTLSQTKIRNSADLSPVDGKLIVLEYSEERPPIQMTKGMASKIVNYYRGDRSKCPISAGGGDRPLRKKKHGNQNEDVSASTGSSGKVEKPPRLMRGTSEKVMDLIGKIPTNKRVDDHHSYKEAKLKILPEGATEILHAKDHGPFIGQIKDGETQTGLISNLFAAPLFQHDPKKTDFLLILRKIPNHNHSDSQESRKLPVVIRPMPDSIFCVGQTEPKTKVYPPESSGERIFFQKFSLFQIAKALQRKHDGLKFDEIKDGLFPCTGVLPNQLRQRITKVATYDKNSQFWTLKEVGEEFQGVEALGREFSPEGVAANWTSRSATLRLQDLGINHIYRTANGTANVAAAMTYLHGQMRAARQRLRILAKLKSRSKDIDGELFTRAEEKLEAEWKALKEKVDVANFIYEEIQLAPWQLTTDFIDVHKEGKGSGMMKLTGLGDPSGNGSGFSFIREVDGKANKVSPNGDGALNERVKKITGTDKDLRKLNMGQMASILRDYGMQQKDIDKLKRWDRVHCIRDLSTKAASDKMADGLERFARGEKMKLSDQKKIYKERIQEIWNRQKLALTEGSGETDAVKSNVGYDKIGDDFIDEETGAKKPEFSEDANEDDSDDEDNDDFYNKMEDEFNDTDVANELVSNQLRSQNGGGKAYLSQANRANTEDSRDAIELAALKRQREEERAVQMDIDAYRGDAKQYTRHQNMNKGAKVIRRRITKTNPDGSQVVTFKFIIAQNEVEKVMAEKKSKGHEKDSKAKRKKKNKVSIMTHEASKNPVGHALFAEEDDGGAVTIHVKKRGRGGRVRKSSDDDYAPSSRSRKTPGSRSKSRSTDKKPKRKRSEDDDLELYVASMKRKGTSNRKERGAARERMPHVMFADRLEQIRLMVEKRPQSGPFHRPVDKRLNVYHEKIKKPIDLQTIRDKIQKYEYRTVHAFIKDFELMKNNAVTFNGLGSQLGNEATSIFEFVKATVDENREDFEALEIAVDEQLNSGSRNVSRSSTPKLPSKIQAGKTANVTIDGITTEVNLGNIQGPFLDHDSNI